MTAIVRETNRYANYFLNLPTTVQWMRDHPKSRYSFWPADGISITQLRQYFGLLLNMGLIDKKSAQGYWTTRPSQITPFFGTVMSFNLFSLISRMLHISDVTREKKRGEIGFDPWCKVRPLLDQFNAAAKQYYTPSQQVSIDESMIGMKNRCVYIQYMPKKRHARFGIKKFQLCDSNGYIIHVELYGGKDFDVHRDEGQAIGVVKQLLEQAQFYNKGYILHTDNFYTKPSLAFDLLKKKTLITGTVRANSKGLPRGIPKKLSVGETRFWRKGEVLIAAFREKKSQRKPCLVLSTAHNASIQEVEIRRKTVKKTSMVLDYNKYMGGVDVSDKMVCHLAAKRATRRYWKKICQNLLDMGVLNSWILHNITVEASMPRDKFIMSLVESLCAPFEPPTPHPRTATANPTHHLPLLDGKKERDCVVCSIRVRGNQGTGRKRSRHWCPACKVGCHELCEPLLEHETDRGLKRKRPTLD